jgi:hypothetical protein
MSLTRWYRPRSRTWLLRAGRTAVVALVVVAFGAAASAATAAQVNIVSKSKSGPGYFKGIQEAVNASTAGDYVLIEPGTYDEAVKVEKAQSGIWIRGMNRNEVIIDGRNKAGNGIEIYKANNVWVENLTVRNFESGENGEPCETIEKECGNEIWWNGGASTSAIGAEGWYGAYLTAYDTGLYGGYGIFTGHETKGSWSNIYASGFNDSGMYLGACQECQAHITGAIMENNSLGYSGSNSGGTLTIENSVFRNNSVGVVPNSEAPGDKPPPQDGECNRPEQPVTPYPEFTSTNIPRCTKIANNLITENNNLSVPVNASTARGAYGTGVILPSTYADLVEHNVISKNANTGLFGIEEPVEGGPPPTGLFFFQLAGNKISNNQFLRDGHHGSLFSGDVTLASGAIEAITEGLLESQSKNNCLSGNSFGDGTFPRGIQGTWGCQNETTPNPGGLLQGVYQYIENAQKEAAEKRKPVGQPVPPPQPTMPNPCAGVPTNPLCH